MVLAAEELAYYAFVAPDDLDRYLVPRLSRRLRAALLAVEQGRVVELEHGRPVGDAPAALL